MRRQISVYLIPLLCCALFVAAQLIPVNYQQMLPLNRVAVGHGEWWRLLSGHFIHINWTHLIFNALVVILFQGLYRGFFTWRQWLVLVPLLCIGVSAGILWLTPLKWYMGFSGVLTGLLVAAAILQWRQMPFINAVVLAAIGIKVFMEQLSGKEVIVSTISHVPTAVDAHLYGAVCGLVLGTLGVVLRR
ncbi:rhombosortase [Porticoccus sp. W117]|uniref:rhombosortase n=1 Tax=Porticoccus sp. W117 TaxID=3054777 RepID=UPI002599ED8E|nr:rhombosortase [Porticoccus sp. W117]MDM3871312.1 rhombosortase [Porticoccus sp. W117]